MSEAEIDDEGELRAQGRYAIDFDLKDFPAYLRQQQAEQTRKQDGAHSDVAAHGDAPAGAVSGQQRAEIIPALSFEWRTHAHDHSKARAVHAVHA